MAEPITNVLGVVSIKNRGEYNSEASYEKLNVVRYNGQTYCAKTATQGNLPTNTNYWDLMVERGEKGDKPVKGVDYYTQSDIEELESSLSSDVTQEVTNQIGELVSATPLAASSVAEMTDTTRIYVNTTDGNWYWYDGTNWVVGGTYQSTAGFDGLFQKNKNILPEFDVAEFTRNGLTIKYSKGLLYIDGTSTSSQYMRLTTSWKIGDTANSIKSSGGATEFEIGKSYAIKWKILQGTITVAQGAANPAPSVRKSDNTMLFRQTDGATTINELPDRVQFYTSSGARFDNCIISVVVYETDTDIDDISYGQNKLSGIELEDLNILIDKISYKIPKSYSNTTIYQDYRNNTVSEKIKNVYTQGMTSDGERYIWYTTWEVNSNTELETTACYLRKLDTTTNTVVASSTELNATIVQHGNGMCYYPTDNCLYVVSLDDNNTLYKFDADSLNYLGSITVERTNLPNHFGAIAYDKTRNKFVALISPFDNFRAIAIYDTDWNLESIMKLPISWDTIEAPTTGVGSAGGIWTDEKHIYLVATNVKDGTENDYNWNSYIYIYDWNCNYVGRMSTNYYHEAEDITKIGEEFYINYNTSTHQYCTLVKITPITYKRKYQLDVINQYRYNTNY